MIALKEEFEKILWECLDKAEVDWCPIREARPEIVVRRDIGTPLSWFAGKTVVIWGCGA